MFRKQTESATIARGDIIKVDWHISKTPSTRGATLLEISTAGRLGVRRAPSSGVRPVPCGDTWSRTASQTVTLALPKGDAASANYVQAALAQPVG